MARIPSPSVQREPIRKTFICYALSIGIPPVMVIRWTGHSDYQSMKPYIDIAAADKAQAMEQFDKTLEPPEDDE